MTDVVVVGGGPAAAGLIQALSQGGHDGEVRVLEAEAEALYDRTVVSKALLTGAMNDPPQVLAEVGARVETSTSVTAIDVDARTVVTADGGTIGWNRLVLATGAAPARPPVEGIEQAGVTVLRSADDGRSLRDHLAPGRHLVIVGGGVIGLEVAGAARQRGATVTVLEVARRPMARILPPAVVAPLLDAHREAGATVRLGVGPTRIAPGLLVACSDGSEVAADHVLVAVGVRPRTALAEAAGLEVDDGVLVDGDLRASDPDVMAVGDVARLRGRGRTQAYTPALAMGRHAAETILGTASGPYDEVPTMWSDQLDLSVHAAGWPEDADTWVDRGTPDELAEGVISFGLADGRVVAVAAISRGRAASRAAGAGRRLIASGAVVAAAELADASVELRSLLRR